MRTCIVCTLIASLTVFSCSNDQEIQMEVTNSLDMEWMDAPIQVMRDQIGKGMEIPAGKLPAIRDNDGDYIPCQADDLNGDGEWDVLYGVMDLGAGETVPVRLVFLEKESYPEFESRTNVRLGAYQEGYPELESADRLEGVSYDNHDITGTKFQMEGPAWENDLVGFRNYLDQRNGMDIFGKTTSKMVLDSVGLEGGHSYHERDWWGQDILKVNTSLGAGSVAFARGDELFRLGDNGSGTYEAVSEGPVHSSFSLTFSNWMVDNDSYDVVQKIDIMAGTRFYESTVSYQGPGELDLVTGIVNMLSDTLYTLGEDGAYTCIYTHDVQTEDTTILAMALVVPSNQLKRIVTAPDEGDGIIQTYYTVLDDAPGQEITYRFYSLWAEEDHRWASLEEVTGYLATEVKKWAAPPKVDVLP